MPRIRSIKPEFWKSETIAAFDPETRLTFIGLWSYVDDNGVGRFNDKLITAELYPLDDPREALARVQRSLASLVEADRVVIYETLGKLWIYVTTWDEHQKVDRPNKARYPRPDDTCHIVAYGLTCDDAEPDPPSRETLATTSRDLRPVVASGAGVQGSRGAGDSAKGGASAEPGRADTAQTLLALWIDNCSKPPPGRVKGQVAQALGQMFAEKIDPADIRAGLHAWWLKGLSPSSLPAVVHEVMNTPTRIGPAPAAGPSRPSTTDARVQDALAVGARLAARAGEPFTPLALGGTP